MKIQKIAIIGILAAIICLAAPFSLPLGAIPISLATLAIYVIGCTVKTAYSLPAVIIYILLGAVGLPVFSLFHGGFHILSGPTGGFIIGYIPCVFVIGLLVNKFAKSKVIYPVSMALGTMLCYLSGTLWYMVQSQADFIAALTVCILPFLAGDIIKITVACIIGIPLRKRLDKIL